MIAVGGGGWPVGHASRNAPSGVGAGLTTLKFTEIASAPEGIPQMFHTVQLRAWPLAKIPPWIGAPLPRVSATRQGWTPTKVRGGVTSVMVVIPPPEDRGYAGTVQLCRGTSADCAERTRAREEIRRAIDRARIGDLRNEEVVPECYARTGSVSPGGARPRPALPAGTTRTARRAPAPDSRIRPRAAGTAPSGRCPR